MEEERDVGVAGINVTSYFSRSYVINQTYTGCLFYYCISDTIHTLVHVGQFEYVKMYSCNKDINNNNNNNNIVVVVAVTAIELSLGGSSPYTSTDKTNKNKYT